MVATLERASALDGIWPGRGCAWSPLAHPPGHSWARRRASYDCISYCIREGRALGSSSSAFRTTDLRPSALSSTAPSSPALLNDEWPGDRSHPCADGRSALRALAVRFRRGAPFLGAGIVEKHRTTSREDSWLSSCSRVQSGRASLPTVGTLPAFRRLQSLQLDDVELQLRQDCLAPWRR